MHPLETDDELGNAFPGLLSDRIEQAYHYRLVDLLVEKMQEFRF
jgi:hypothetical protein